MKKVFSKRNLIIMFFPVIFVLVILTLGLPQQVLTAVTIGGGEVHRGGLQLLLL